MCLSEDPFPSIFPTSESKQKLRFKFSKRLAVKITKYYLVLSLPETLRKLNENSNFTGKERTMSYTSQKILWFTLFKKIMSLILQHTLKREFMRKL
jgi:hypothetical protein